MDNLRFIKKHIWAKKHRALLLPPPGEDQTALEEVSERLILDESLHQDAYGLWLGGVDYRRIMELALSLKTLREIFWLVGEGRLQSRKDLDRQLSRIPFGVIWPSGAKVNIRVDSFRSTMFHEKRLEHDISAAIKALGYAVCDRATADHHLWLVVRENDAKWLIALGGRKRLYQRAYKITPRHAAPLPEHLAACLIRRVASPWFAASQPKPIKVLVPFAGSGTLGFESILFQSPSLVNVWPNDHAFQSFPCTPEKTLGHLKKSAAAKASEVLFRGKIKDLTFIELDSALCDALKTQVASFLDGYRPINPPPPGALSADPDQANKPMPIRVIQQDALTFDWSAEAENFTVLFIPLNPPFGLRLKEHDGAQIYDRLGAWLERQRQQLLDPPHKNNQGIEVFGFCLCPDAASEKLFSQHLRAFQTTTLRVRHGGKELRMVQFEVK